MSIELSPNLSLPLDFATESCAIIAKRGAGKTHTARVVAEDLLAGHVQTVIVDPVDVWWGLRSGKDGKSKGAEVVIFGGNHGDLPLTETMGAAVADLIIKRGVSAVLVLDHLTRSAQCRFASDFFENIYDGKSGTEHRTPLHLIIDEADAFMPQKPWPGSERCLGMGDRIVRRGRSRGLGTTLISQRPAVLNKDVLTQSEVLITLQLNAPQDRKAVQEWVDANASGEDSKAFLASLAVLKRGEAWIWSPSKYELFQRTLIRDTRTFDSSFTPKVGGRKQQAPKLTDVDIEAIKQSMKDVLEEQAANDPKLLKARIKELEKQVRAKGSKRAVNQSELRELVEEALAPINRSLRTAEKERDDAADALRKIQALCTAGMPSILADSSGSSMRPMSRRYQRHVQQVLDRSVLLGPGDPPAPVGKAIKAKAAELTEGLDSEMTGPERKILTVLAQHGEHHPGDALHHSTLAIRSGYSYSGGFRNYLSALKGKGWIGKREGVGFFATSDGLQALGDYESMPRGSALLDWWRERVTGPEQKILDHLAVVPTGLGGPALAANTGYEWSGGFRNYISSLRTKGLIIGRGRELLKLHPDLQD